MEKQIVWLTAPGQFWTEFVRSELDANKIAYILVYWTRRQLLELLTKTIKSPEIINSLNEQLYNKQSWDRNDFPWWIRNDPFFENWWNIFDTIGNIPMIFTCNPESLRDANIVFIWQSMSWISAEFERFPWELSTVKNLKKFIDKNAIVVSLAKGISKWQIPMDPNKQNYRTWAKTWSEELEQHFNKDNIVVIAWPSSANSLAQAVYDPDLHRFFFNIASISQKARQRLIEILNTPTGGKFNKAMVWVKETDDLLWTQLLWALKNVFAFSCWILEWYWVSDETISLYKFFIQQYLVKIFKKIWLKDNLIYLSPAGMPDLDLTIKKWRNGEGGRKVWKYLKSISDQKFTAEQIKKWIEWVIENYWKTVEWYHSVSWLAQKLINLWLFNNDIILISRLERLLNWKTRFEKTYQYILQNIEFPLD